ncbi:hypothetical protein NFX46_04020 [Streptomyces phaeoluteigriseus]|uniref:L,D-transpeptidase n=1 Tax=Streptomyces phaeoluteigriseus TaxID=114686 RepID=A0ABY4Z325_9ACTN|nr:hypothetical protein [Streptomyces phaeoluteigriseus]USQ83013.1 hypothetical protein NFX46_04020 [Streptomyces phaeoluteigriseus]
MAGSSSTFVAALTAAAVATVGFLAFQASANVPADLASPPAAASPTTTKAPRDIRDLTALPARSGTGARVVYSVDDDRVWLVAEDGRPTRTFQVTPGSVDPLPGTYAVTSRSGAVTGTDGTPIEHVVRFTDVKGVSIGFSAAVDGSKPVVDPIKKTGGIRASRPDGKALWDFATIGQRVVVIR